jgi:hypothetical protein
MKTIFALIFMLILGTIVSLFLPWWTIAIVCFGVAMYYLDNSSEAALAGFFSVFILWGFVALIKSYQNDFILLTRMAELLPLHNEPLIIISTAFLGGIIGMLSSMSGVFLQSINKKPRKEKYYT